MRQLTAADAARPLVTHYDLALGSRVELSGVSAANWAAKVAGLLRDDLGLAPGDEVLLDLPLHWLTPAVLSGCWWAGVGVTTDPSASMPAAVLTTAERVDAHDPMAEILAMSTDPMGRDLTACGVTLPVGVTDLVAAARVQPDTFVSPTEPVVSLDGAGVAELAAGVDVGARLLVREGDRALTRVARALAAQASMVLVTGGGDTAEAAAEIERIAGTEKVTGEL